ncbi:MAG: B12-binding domain-containing radical SAM protein, partial [bacterium]
MKISISFPPLESEKGVPLLAQNRQFQWFNSPTFIYPMIPAYAATLLKKNNYEVFWDDGIAEEMTYEKWLTRIIKEKPDLIAMETKTPVVKMHWQ